jgi:hypothetical protein
MFNEKKPAPFRGPKKPLGENAALAQFPGPWPRPALRPLALVILKALAPIDLIALDPDSPKGLQPP